MHNAAEPQSWTYICELAVCILKLGGREVQSGVLGPHVVPQSCFSGPMFLKCTCWVFSFQAKNSILFLMKASQYHYSPFKYVVALRVPHNSSKHQLFKI